MAERDALIEALMRNPLQAGGTGSDLTTADILSRMPPPAWGGLKSYLPEQPDWMKSAQRAFGSTVIGGMNKLAETLPPGVFDAMTTVMPGARAVRIQNPIRAYHGSPHDFSEFRMDKIGTGEGAQAYGHGLYFAEKEGVARSYRDTLAKQNANVIADKWDWAKQIPRDLWEVLFPGPTQTRAEAADFLKNTLAEYRRAADRAKTLAPQGKMYEVALHATPESFLDWDKPMRAQSEMVQEALKKAGVDPYIHMSREDPLSMMISGKQSKLFPMRVDPSNTELLDKIVKGRSAFEQLENQRNFFGTRSGSKGASSALSEAGIPGIRYLDQGSRGAGQGTSNYVVFPGSEGIIEILRKYGIAGPAALGAMNALSPSDQQ